MQGQIWVESTKGVGSCFYFQLTFPKQVITELSVTNDILGKDLLNKKLLQNSHILVAEDDIVNQKIYEHIFKTHNIQYTIVPNGLEALTLIQKHEYDFILLDENLPLMKGREVITKLASFIDYPNKYIPIIRVSGAINVDLDTLFKIQKPFEEFELINALIAAKKVYLKEYIKNTFDLSFFKFKNKLNTNLILDVSHIFYHELSINLDKIKLAYQQHEYFEIINTIHKIKPNIAMFGLDTVYHKFSIWEKLEFKEFTQEIILQIEEEIKMFQKQLLKINVFFELKIND